MKKDKWSSLSHNGPLFPKSYEYKKLPIIVKGKEYILDVNAEEMAYAWAAKSETPYIKNKVFQENFWNDFKKYLPKDLQSSVFPNDWDFTKMYSYILRTREEKKNLPKEVKLAEKDERDKLKAIYGKANLDGIEVDLGAYIVEPAGIYMGRGNHPKSGAWKVQAKPEDITINISKGSPTPIPPKGHHWKEVVENKGAFWTCKWYNNIDGSSKRILFGATSFVKQNADKKKFTKAIKLAQNWDKVVKHIDKNLSNENMYIRKVATVSKLISVMSIRVGDEKGEDTADTVGASSLRSEHIKLIGNKIEFDFLGKDSIRYHNIVEFESIVISNFRDFMIGKKPDEKIFDEISSSSVTEFLSEVMEGLTAKVFRTATGSNLLAQELRNQAVDPSLKEAKKLSL